MCNMAVATNVIPKRHKNNICNKWYVSSENSDTEKKYTKKIPNTDIGSRKPLLNFTIF